MTATSLSGRATSLGSGDLREVLMGAQDNLTNVLAIVLGVSIGSGDVRLVAMAGLAAGLAEAISMGGVLYSATRAEHRVAGTTGRPVRAAVVCFAAALIAGLIPLAPFLSLPLDLAMVASLSTSLTAIFALGAWTGVLMRSSWWREGVRLVLIADLAAAASAGVGLLLGA